MRKHHTPEFKARVVQEMFKEVKTTGRLAAEYGVHPNLLYHWRSVALDGLPSLFSNQTAQAQAAREAVQAQQFEELYAEIGRLTTQLAWLKKTSGGHHADR